MRIFLCPRPISLRMNLVESTLKRHTLISAIYVATILLSFHYVFVVYINSNFLDGFFGEKLIGFLYAIGSLINIAAFFYISRILEKIRNYRLLLVLVVLEIAALVGLALSHNIYLIGALFIIHHAINPIMLFSLDVFLERLSSDNKTGSIRGTFLTIINTTFVFSPLLVGIILGSGENFPLIYLISSGFLLPFFYVIYKNFRNLPHKPYKEIDIKATVRAFTHNKNVRNIFIVSFLLQFFYAWMTIYTPLYLHTVIGFSLKDIGIIFSIMLLPFIIFQIPLGELADKKLGEKEILSIGIVVMALSTIALSFIASKNLALWAVLLFLTRIGASAVEIMTESYFFKQVDGTDTNLISFFRNARPLSYILGPLVASIFLTIVSSQYLFLILGILMLLGLRYTLTLKDTR